MTRPALEKTLRSYFPFGFHLTQKVWEQLGIIALLDSPELERDDSGVYSMRLLADRFNEISMRSPAYAEPVQAGQLYTVGVIVEILRYLVVYYCHDEIPGVISRSLDWTGHNRGPSVAKQPPPVFVDLYPPPPVLRKKQTGSQYLQAASEISTNVETVAGEMILLSLAMENPAFRPFRTLFDDADLKNQTPYLPLIGAMEEFFGQQPVLGPIGMTLFQCLRAPILASPDSLEGQLDYIKIHWAKFLPPDLLKKLFLARDILKEERMQRGYGPGPNLILQFSKRAYGYDTGYAEPACFSPDADWMSNVVLIAKSIYVWLDQLSKKYKRTVRYLNDIPDEELDQLARWGFTGLWLIGVWERSPASQKIKQIMGNPEALPSAYSLYDYVIASDLGGEPAFQDLRRRAWQRGIRLASDMVPNHMGIYSKWVIEHPDWFLQSDYPPFPCYQFTGVDLSSDPRVCIQVEDGYWQHRDAAVVFRRLDKWTGDTKYIYHGNDGTSTPWNDTAQLNFLIPQVREAVIQTILHVARKFPIIRFDAAMTLAKRHYQRLWFPPYGEGGAIPSRAERGMSKADFDAVFPKEFWREVVDRVATELPDTLLLAEAFWLMEGYFVRTLGMHRVYNSSFMNMLKMEDNGKYRKTVKNVLEFSAEVIKRFVNFMNNPDELTAIQQFGRDDKYFGVAILMVTMPGLPMFGHGQIEGFTEKYGMEYRRAYWDERIDDEMVRRHETEVFPLMRRRRLFSGVENFAFYDFHTPEGWVDENVFAYSNRAGDERAIILYNNAYNTTQGRIHTSTPINIGIDEKGTLVRKTLAEALSLKTGDNCLYSFRDHRTGFGYLRSGKQIADEGLFARLHGYQYHAFLDFREIYDLDGSWAELNRRLNGKGVPNLEEAYGEMRMESLLAPLSRLLNGEMLDLITEADPLGRERLMQDLPILYSAVLNHKKATFDYDEILRQTLSEFDSLPHRKKDGAFEAEDHPVLDIMNELGEKSYDSLQPVGYGWIVVHNLKRLLSSGDNPVAGIIGGTGMEEWIIRKTLAGAFREFGGNEAFAYYDALLVTILSAHEDVFLPAEEPTLSERIQKLLNDTAVKEYLQVNLYQDVLWLNKEQLERMVGALLMTAVLRLHSSEELSDDAKTTIRHNARSILAAAHDSAYQLEKTIQALSPFNEPSAN